MFLLKVRRQLEGRFAQHLQVVQKVRLDQLVCFERLPAASGLLSDAVDRLDHVEDAFAGAPHSGTASSSTL